MWVDFNKFRDFMWLPERKRERERESNQAERMKVWGSANPKLTRGRRKTRKKKRWFTGGRVKVYAIVSSFLVLLFWTRTRLKPNFSVYKFRIRFILNSVISPVWQLFIQFLFYFNIKLYQFLPILQTQLTDKLYEFNPKKKNLNLNSVR